jgi:hypothetical protein
MNTSEWHPVLTLPVSPDRNHIDCLSSHRGAHDPPRRQEALHLRQRIAWTIRSSGEARVRFARHDLPLSTVRSTFTGRNTRQRERSSAAYHPTASAPTKKPPMEGVRHEQTRLPNDNEYAD